MGRARKKLHSESGASILMALLVVLVVMMVSVVILSAAYANAGRTKRNKAEEQAYLTVSSAAELMRDCVTGTGGGEGLKYKLIDITTATADNDGNVTTQKTHTIVPISGSVAFGRLMDDLITDTDAGNYTDKTFDITAGNMDGVAVTFIKSRTDKYGFTADFSLKENRDGANCYITLSCKAEQTAETETAQSADGKTTTTKVTTTIFWPTADITQGVQPSAAP